MVTTVFVYGTVGADDLFAPAGRRAIVDGGPSSAPESDTGNDHLTGNSWSCTLLGRGGDDTLIGGVTYDDQFTDLYGDEGADELHLNGRGRMSGGPGDDRLFAVGRPGYVPIDGGDGVDTLDWQIGGIESVNLRVRPLGFPTEWQSPQAYLTSIEAFHLTTSSANDSVHLGAGDDRVQAGEGDDRVKGGAGSDTLDGGAGNDTLTLGDGAADSAIGGTGDDLLDLTATGPGTTTVDGQEGNDTVLGGLRDDSIAGGAGADILLGGAGNDVLVADLHPGNAAAADLLRGEAGDDRLESSGGKDTLDGGDGIDTLAWRQALGTAGAQPPQPGVTLEMRGGSKWTLLGPDGTAFRNIERIDFAGGNGDDSVVAGGDADTLLGGSGDDTLEGRDGADRLDGGLGSDVLLGGGGNDTLQGSGNRDLLWGGPGADHLASGAGGFDFFRYRSADEGGDVISFHLRDRIQVSASGFGGGLQPGGNLLGTGFFAPDGAASAAHGQFLWQQTGAAAGNLLWDADGTGANAALLIASISAFGSWSLAASDIFVVA
jgi:Ca2+-binding RTX toxin-like protein